MALRTKGNRKSVGPGSWPKAANSEKTQKEVGVILKCPLTLKTDESIHGNLRKQRKSKWKQCMRWCPSKMEK